MNAAEQTARRGGIEADATPARQTRLKNVGIFQTQGESSMNNPLVEEAAGIRQDMKECLRALEVEVIHDVAARRTVAVAKQAYQDAEAQAMFGIVINADGKNAEIRKAQIDAALMDARNDVLRATWAEYQAAIEVAESAKAALEMDARHFRALESMAELISASLRFLAV